ncbi:MAG: DUF4097 family beta strand repeat-containing protein, partial [Candidatus Sericytochromatia bacterium]
MSRSSLLLTTALLAAAAPAMAASTPPAPVVTEQQVILPADGPYEIDLENLKGRVVVRDWNKNVAYVRAEKRATHALGASEADLFTQAKPTVWHQQGEVAIRTDWGAAAKTYPAVLLAKTPHVVVDYTVVVPPETVLRLKQEQGDVVLYGVDGRFEVTVRDGAIAATALKGRLEATTERGDVTVSALEGDAVVTSQTGDLRFREVAGDLRARTHSGEVRIDVGPRFAGEVSFHTVSGDFRSDLATYS